MLHVTCLLWQELHVCFPEENRHQIKDKQTASKAPWEFGSRGHTLNSKSLGKGAEARTLVVGPYPFKGKAYITLVSEDLPTSGQALSKETGELRTWVHLSHSTVISPWICGALPSSWYFQLVWANFKQKSSPCIWIPTRTFSSQDWNLFQQDVHVSTSIWGTSTSNTGSWPSKCRLLRGITWSLWGTGHNPKCFPTRTLLSSACWKHDTK